MSAAGKDIFSPLSAPRRRAWSARVESPPRGAAGIQRLSAIVQGARTHRCVVLDGSERREIVAAALLAGLRTPAAVVISEATWKMGRNPVDHLFARYGIRLVDGPRVHYAVISTFERERFPKLWGVDRARVSYTPYLYTLADEELEVDLPGDGTIFAGGDSLRDYGPLVEAMRAVRNPLLIGTRQRRRRWMRSLPANVVARPVSQREYKHRTASASVVVVPLEARGDRSAGQATYLNAMALRRAVVVTDVAGARDYIRDGETGVIVPPGDPRALADALRSLLDDPRRARRIGEAARADVLARFGPDRYLERLLELADRAAAS